MLEQEEAAQQTPISMSEPTLRPDGTMAHGPAAVEQRGYAVDRMITGSLASCTSSLRTTLSAGLCTDRSSHRC